MNQEHTTTAVAEEVTQVQPASSRKGVLIAGLVLSVLLVGGVVTILSRTARARALAKETEQNALPTVAVINPTATKPQQELLLPGSLQAYTESPIYARTNGYLVRWYKDIGSHINKGDLLAQIDTPEVDQELSQARAARQQI